jgi:hypothetical protein
VRHVGLAGGSRRVIDLSLVYGRRMSRRCRMLDHWKCLSRRRWRGRLSAWMLSVLLLNNRRSKRPRRASLESTHGEAREIEMVRLHNASLAFRGAIRIVALAICWVGCGDPAELVIAPPDADVCDAGACQKTPCSLYACSSGTCTVVDMEDGDVCITPLGEGGLCQQGMCEPSPPHVPCPLIEPAAYGAICADDGDCCPPGPCFTCKCGGGNRRCGTDIAPDGTVCPNGACLSGKCVTTQ